jgi:hypothetical protein
VYVLANNFEPVDEITFFKDHITTRGNRILYALFPTNMAVVRTFEMDATLMSLPFMRPLLNITANSVTVLMYKVKKKMTQNLDSLMLKEISIF